MKRILVLLLALNSVQGFSANFNKIERDTINSAFETLQTLQVLYFISDMCDKREYRDLAPRNELNAMVQSKLHIGLEKFERIANDSESYIMSMEYQKEGITCDAINVDEYLSILYDDYDVLLFSLDLYEPISSPLTRSNTD